MVSRVEMISLLTFGILTVIAEELSLVFVIFICLRGYACVCRPVLVINFRVIAQVMLVEAFNSF